jgi:hypothetical protein
MFVTQLSLRCCNINDQEAVSLLLGLVDNTCITHVWLRDKDITDEGVECLIATLESNQTVIYSVLMGNLGINPALADKVWLILKA